MKKIILILIVQFYCANDFAQTNLRATIVPKNAPFEWGKISQEDLDMKVYPPDSSADAVVLNNEGLISDEIHTASSYLKQYKRIKFLKKSSFDNNSVFKIIYHSGLNKEWILSLRAQIIQPDGRIRVLKESEFVDEVYNDNYSIKKIIFPELKEGTVAEIEYEKASMYYFPVNEWYFQEEIPVRRCDLHTKLFKTDNIIIGKVGKFSIRRDGFKPSGAKSDIWIALGSNSSVRPENYTPKYDVRHYYADSITAIKPENFSSSVNDYLTHFYFQINSYYYTGADAKNIQESWRAYIKELNEETYFGNYLRYRKGNAWRDIVSKIDEKSTKEQKMATIFNFLKEKMEWTGGEDIIPAESFNQVYKEKKGNCADINLLLVALLNEAGIKANPVLISTRSNGKAIENIPVVHQFNYVVCLAELDSEKVFLDATNAFLPTNLIRIEALNDRGLVIDKKNPHWIDIVPQPATTQRVLNIELDKNLKLSGSLLSGFKGYDAYFNRRIGIKKEELDKKTKEFFSEAGADVLIEKITDSNLKDLAESYKTTTDFKITDAANTIGDISYINPTLKLFKYNKNPFKEKERKYPIDLTYPERESIISTIKIPENLSVSELPKSFKLVLPNNDAVFQYQIAAADNQIVCNVKLILTRLHYEAADYKALKDFFDQVAAKLNEPIVFKKK